MKFKDALYIGAIVAGICVWAYTSFASIQYVDAKHKEVKEDMLEIKQDIKEIKSLILEQYKTGGKPKVILYPKATS